MLIEIDKLAEYMGELVAAAKHDHDTADPADVGMNGVPIKHWRAAYYEGCKDMVQGLVGRVPQAAQQDVQAIVRAAFDKTLAELKAAGLKPVKTESETHHQS